MQIGNGDDSQHVRFDLKDDAVRETADQATPRVLRQRRPCLRILRDSSNRRVYFLGELKAKPFLTGIVVYHSLIQFTCSPTVIENYSHLWQIEKAFRISKTDLRIRPIYHYRRRRIESHLCIAFVAYAIFKELEMLLKNRGIEMSAHRAAELTQNMYELHYTLPDSNEHKRFIPNMDKEQQTQYQCLHGDRKSGASP